MLSLWSDTAKHMRKNAGYALGYVVCSAMVGGGFRAANKALGANLEGQTGAAWMPLYHVASLLWLGVGAALCASVFFSLIGRSVDRPLWKCRDWREGVRRFFLTWFILSLSQITVIEFMIKLADAGILGPLPSLLMLDLALQAVCLPLGACVMYWGRLDWGQLPQALEPIYGQFLLTLPVMFIGVGQWLLVDLRSSLIPEDTALEILWLGLYDAMLDFVTCFAFIMMWRVCMIHRDRSIEGGGHPFDF